MTRAKTSRKKPKKSEQTFSTILAGATLSLIMIYFIQSAMVIANKNPVDAAIANYEQQVQLEKG
ncbi:hypothetical protein L4D76_01475 [Photobacterium sagamiensis]|uniref:hypothetical protein n=1 Tax=Photobacterium sagamiensis TaxID=2910241 RepID=UPI003D0B450B